MKSLSTFIRDDYKELRDLILFVLSGTDSDIITLKKPGDLSNARFMAKAIYTLKAFILADELDLDVGDRNNIKMMAVFITHIYGKYWFRVPCLADAALLDLQLFKELSIFQSFDKKTGQNVLHKLSLHQNYLQGDLVGFSLFSTNVSCHLKQKIVTNIKKYEPSWSKPTTEKLILRSDSELDDFVDGRTFCGLRACGIDMENILAEQVQNWPSLPEYQAACDIINNINIVCS